MNTILDRVVEVQDQVVESLGQVKDPAVNAAETATKFIEERAEGVLRPAPFAEKLPTPEELIKAEFDFAGKMLDTTRDALVAVAQAAAPVTNKWLDRKPKPVRTKKAAA
ncbi:MAG: hypothetical protein R2754_13040 [Microthrixaceae bacterium]